MAPERPAHPVEIAEWLTRMFDHINPVSAPQGLLGDINPADRSVVEGLYQAGVTRACFTTPLLYCPDQPVTRAQMASFIIYRLGSLHPYQRGFADLKTGTQVVAKSS